MKTMKRAIAVLVAAAALAVAAAAPAFAATYTLSIATDVEGRTYSAYQIFAGDVMGGILSNVTWGAGVAPDSDGKIDGMTATQAVASLNSGTVEEFAEHMMVHLDDAEALLLEWRDELSLDNNLKGYEKTGLEGGYYLVVDSTDLGTSGTYDAHILQVAGDVIVSPKSGAPSLTKKVSKSLSSQYSEAISLTRGDIAYFSLTATLPNNIAHYEKYYMQIADTLPEGLILAADAEDILVFVVNGSVTNELRAEDYNIEVSDLGEGGTSIVITIDDVVTAVPNADTDYNAPIVASDTIVVAFAVKLNGDYSVYGSKGNTNTAILKYSNNPNDADVYNTSLSATPEQTATVYTYQLKVTKVDSVDPTKKLAGATFKLHRYKNGSTDEYLKETATEDGTVHTWVSDIDEATEFVSDSNGEILMSGLSAGVYRLIETKAPGGYNLSTEPIRLTVTDSISAAGVLESLAAREEGGPVYGVPSADIVSGVISLSVSNNAGATLPTTGGIGTTIFYVIGAALVICAAAALVVRRRGSERR